MSIKVSFENVDDHSRTFNKIRNSFSDDFLGITDEKTTISANANGKEAFEKATETMVKMGNNISIEEKNIKSIGLEFKEYDSAVSFMWNKLTKN